MDPKISNVVHKVGVNLASDFLLEKKKDVKQLATPALSYAAGEYYVYDMMTMPALQGVPRGDLEALVDAGLMVLISMSGVVPGKTSLPRALYLASTARVGKAVIKGSTGY